MRRRYIPAAVGILAALGLGLVLLQTDIGHIGSATESVGESDGVAPHGSVAASGIRQRSSDPANFVAAEHTIDQSRLREFQLEADRAQDLMQALKTGAEPLSPMLIDLDFSDTALETYAKCSSRFLRSPCAYEIDYVVEVAEPGHGEIAFGRVVMEHQYAEDCEQYTRCIVQGNVGASVRVPSDSSGLLAHRKTQVDNYPEITVGQLNEMLEILAEGVALLEGQGPDGSADWEYRLELERSYITLVKLRIAEMGE